MTKNNLELIYKIKQRPESKKIACLYGSLSQLKNAILLSNFQENEIKKNLKNKISYLIEDSNGETHCIRIPNHVKLKKLLLKTGPLYATSCNISGSIPLNNYQSIENTFQNLINFCFYQEEPLGTKASQIIDLRKDQKTLVRD